MQQIVEGVFDWSGYHEGIRRRVHSTYVAATDPPVLIDPMPMSDGTERLARRPPAHVYLTNRHHYRGADRFVHAFDCDVHCHAAGLYEFGEGHDVKGFHHGDVLPGGIRAVEVGSLCAEETAFHVPVGKGVLAFGDAVVRFDTELTFVPEEYMGTDPEGVKRGIREAIRRVLASDLRFDTMVCAHGAPWVGGAREALAAWLEAGS